MDDGFDHDFGLDAEANMHDEDVPFTSTISLSTRDQKGAGSGGAIPAPPPPPRQRSYFILRSNSMFNLSISQKEGAWCTLRFNEPKLDEAFAKQGSEVRLLFSATGTYAFQGWATMTTKIASLGRVVLWEYGKTYGPPFGCHWKCIFNLTESDPVIGGLTNPWNNNLPILNAGDGQEIPQEIGDLIVQRMEQRAAAEGINPPPAPPPPMPLSQRFTGPRPGPPFGGRGGYGGGPPLFGAGRGMGGREMGDPRPGNIEAREEKNELLDMTYEEYLQVYERVRLKMSEIKEIKPAVAPVPPPVPPPHQIQPYQQPTMTTTSVRPAGMGGMNQMASIGMGATGTMNAGTGGGGMGSRPYTEAEYIAVTVNHFRSMGKPPPSEDYIRQHYRQSLMS